MHSFWQRSKDLVADALELPAEGRAAFVATSCAGDEVLQREVLSMLDAATTAGDFLDEPAALPVSVQFLPVGTRIGPYEIEEVIGEGGFSEVYRAGQTEPIRRQVALKLLKPGMDSRAVLSRFASERQVLARLHHKNIAGVLDAGATETGRPFVVMELVIGQPLRQHADSAKLGIEARLDLLLQVCEAVAHAHRRGVIHRDLKPSNVMVEVEGDTAQVKVIDFGIAKLRDAANNQNTRTAMGVVLGTPAYASPEQLRGDPDDVDTRADVWAIGGILHELLTGSPPHRDPTTGLDAPTWSGHGPERAKATVELRRIAPELDWILATALAADRDRRYPSVDALAADIRNFLAGVAVTVGPPTRRYRFAKFVRRHKALLVCAALGLLALSAGGVLATIGFIRAAEARDDANAMALEATLAKSRAERLAEQEAAAREHTESALREAETVGNFLAQLLASARPDRSGREVRVVDLLAATGPLFDRVAAFPDAAARLFRIVGGTYAGLGDFAAAHRNLEQALIIYETRYGKDDWRRIEVLFDIASLHYRQGHITLGAPSMKEVADRARATRGPNHPLARLLLDLEAKTHFEQGHVDEAAKALRGLLELEEADGNTSAIIKLLGNLSQVLLQGGHRDEARSLAQRAHELARAHHGDGQPDTLIAGRKLASVYIQEQDYPALVTMVEPLVEQARARLGPAHPDTLGLENYLALGYQHTGRLEEAETLYRRLLISHDETLGKQHPQVIMALHNFGLLLEARDDLPGSEALLHDAAARFLELRGPEHIDTCRANLDLARVIARQGRNREIAGGYAAAIAALDRRLGPEHTSVRIAKSAWAEHLLRCAAECEDEGLSAEQKQALLTAFTTFRELGDAPNRRRVANALAIACESAGDHQGAVQWRAESQ